MNQFDLSAEMLAFHDQHVRLDDASVERLRRVRDLNLNRIRDGLDDLERPRFKDWRNQGGFAMETVVNDPAGESNHDLDVALIFDKDDLPAAALDSRKRVRDALSKRASRFLQEPEARTNAVTVWYADGYHLDFAVYRRTKDVFDTYHYEHASTHWIARDPDEVTTWFSTAVDDKSPNVVAFGTVTKVRLRQLRRIVRLIKWFCRSRPSWNLPGGMLASTLAIECYRPDRERDDVALYNTLVALKIRLSAGCRVYHPNGGGRELTGKAQYLNQVNLLKSKLDENLPKLAKLFDSDCTRTEARGAWDWIFNHQFWASKEVVAEDVALVEAATKIAGHTVAMECELSTQHGRNIGTYSGQVLPKDMSLTFSVTSTTVPPPYDIRFEVKNTGDEARQAKQLDWSGNASSYNPRWSTSTAYKGTHRMTCYIIKGGVTLASNSIIVKIAGGFWSGRRR